ncbi:hypothetical protein OEZ60_19310 [Defluviimonas sp. WL0024]|uniref:Uncharacterized protein n=1 Tax=Albidovulum salinarum TaxID=2984153 RepID=A0ABT2X865_9RHOB|nr:hypothetical protein [Defluviimonas sp. WL0024]MCU9850143.1 hypothetical protein [Defluviimonas sp. WL0024]
MRLTLTAYATVIALAATPASAFISQNGLVVQPEGPDSFFVPWRGRGGPSDFWCAAGDYAIRVLKLNPTQLIYRASEPPRRAGEGIRFTLRSDAAASSTGLAVLGATGAGITAGHALGLCEFRRKLRERRR